MGTAGSSSSRVNGPAPSDNGGPVDPKPKADAKRAAKPKSVKDQAYYSLLKNKLESGPQASH